jgi:hypothetical protein
MISFEIQLFREGTWKTDSIYDERGLAELEARRMETLPRYKNLRIIEEVYDEKSETTKLRTIYRDKGFMEKVAKQTEKSRLKDSHVEIVTKREQDYQTRRQQKNKSGSNFTRIAINLTLIAVVGIAGMVALKFLSNMS